MQLVTKNEKGKIKKRIILICLFLLISSVLSAQIKIKERIELTAEKKKPGSITRQIVSENGKDWIIQNTGQLIVSFAEAYRFDGMIEPGTFIVKLNNKIIAEYGLEVYDTSYIEIPFPDGCVINKCDEYRSWDLNHYYNVVEVKDGSSYFNLTNVKKGDTLNVSFVFHGDTLSVLDNDNELYIDVYQNYCYAAFRKFHDCYLSCASGNYPVPLYGYTIYCTILKPSYIKVEFEPSSISPGDTADIKLEKWNEDFAIYEPFSTGQIYNASLLEGCENGKILWMDSLGSCFNNITGKVKFVADSTINSDSVAATVRVNIPEEGGASIVSTKPIIAGNKDKANAEEKSLSKNRNIESLENINSSSSSSSLSKIQNRLNQTLKYLPEELRNRILQNREKQVNKQKEQKLTNKANDDYCFYISNYHSGDGIVPIIKSNCDGWECDGVVEPPKFELEILPNGSYGYDVCGDGNVGITSYIWNNLFEYDVEPCFNSETDRWYFKEKDGIIKVRFIYDICNNNLYTDYHSVINSEDELNNIPISEIDNVIKDIQTQFTYSEGWGIQTWPANGKKFYYVKEWITKHENYHLDDYTEDFNVLKSDSKLRNRFFNWKPTCDNFYNLFGGNYDKIRRKGIEIYKGILSGQGNTEKEWVNDENCMRYKLNKLVKNRKKKLGYTVPNGYWCSKDMNNDYVDYEQYTQGKVFNILQKYINTLEEIKKKKK